MKKLLALLLAAFVGCAQAQIRGQFVYPPAASSLGLAASATAACATANAVLYNASTPCSSKYLTSGTAGVGLIVAAGVSVDNTGRALNISGGWTDGTTGNIGIVFNADMGATGTATGKLLSLQAGAAGTTEVFSVSQAGAAGVGLGSISAPTLFFTGSAGTGFSAANADTIDASVSTAQVFRIAANVIRMGASTLQFNSSPSFSSATSGLSEVSSGVIGVGTGAVASVAGQLHAGMLQASLGTALTLTQGAIGMSKMTASGSAPGASGLKLEVVCGTNAGSAKITALAGTSTTPVTVVDNIGSGVSGC